MQNAIIVDLQPLNCVGLQACLQRLFPEIKCLLVPSEQLLDTLPSTPIGVDLIILGLNQEHNPLLTHLKEKVLAIAGKARIIICYQNFELDLIKSFGRHAGMGLIRKDNIQDELAQCIEKIAQGHTYLCEDTSQYLIGAFVRPPKLGRVKRVQQLAQTRPGLNSGIPV